MLRLHRADGPAAQVSHRIADEVSRAIRRPGGYIVGAGDRVRASIVRADAVMNQGASVEASWKKGAIALGQRIIDQLPAPTPR